MLIRRALLLAALLSIASPVPAQELKVDVDALKNLVNQWNDAHNSGDAEKFSPLYADEVNFYGSILARQKCISLKRSLFEKHEDFHQTINNDLLLSGYSTGVVRCDFVKTVNINDKAVDHKAYLVVQQVNGNYFIVGESDLLTDKNLGKEMKLGDRVAVKDIRTVATNQKSDQNNVDAAVSTSESTIGDTFWLGGSLIVGIAGLVLAYRLTRNYIETKETADLTKEYYNQEMYEKGLAFEKFIVEQFDIYNTYFTLQDWRSDKSHRGITPKSNKDPDFVYEFKNKDFHRTFSVECKYRSKPFRGWVNLMTDEKYQGYKEYHLKKMPVYVVLGIGGLPNDPEEMYLIPFDAVKPQMHYGELSKYRKGRKFYYDVNSDRLT